MKKRLLATLLCVAMLASLLTVGAAAAGEGEQVTLENGTCGDNLTWELDEYGTLTISGTGDMWDYNHYGTETNPAPWVTKGQWSWENNTITKVVIGEGVTRVGNEAFQYCNVISEVDFPSTLKSIGDSAFVGNQVHELNLPAGLESIGNYAFELSWCLESVTLPDGLKSIGYGAFGSAVVLKKAIIPESVTEIGLGAFGTLKTAGPIGSGCELEFGWTTSIPDNAFGGSGADNDQYSSFTSITLPDTITSIGDNAFRASQELKYIRIPDGVKSIGAYAFWWSGIESIDLPAGLETIGAAAFSQCENLNNIDFPDSLRRIEDSAFEYCVNLSSVHIPESVNYIGSKAFADSEWDEELAKKSINFEGDAPVCTDSGETGSFPSDATLYYLDGTDGWIDSENYDASTGLWRGYKLEALDADHTPQIVELSPANGASISETATTDFMVTYDTPISVTETSWGNYVNLDFSKGSIEIHRSSDNYVIYTVEENDFLNDYFNIEGTYSTDIKVENGNTLVFSPFNVHTLFDAGEEYYVTIPAGLFTFENGATNEAVEKGEWAIHILKTFTLGEDNNSFAHTNRAGGGFEGVKDYSFKGKSHLTYLHDNLSFIDWISIALETRHTILNNWGGSCFGIASTISVIYNGAYSLSDISNSGADNFYELPFPCEDDKLYDTINFYQVVQSLVNAYTIFRANPDTPEVMAKLIDWLEENPEQAIVFTYGYKIGGESHGHAIVALNYTKTNDGTYYVRLYDENCISTDGKSKGRFIDMRVERDFSGFSFVDANGNTINQDTCTRAALIETKNMMPLPGDSSNYSSSSREGSSTAKLVVTLTDGLTLTNGNGQTLYADKNGLPTGTMPFLDAVPFTLGPDDTSNKWLLTVPAVEDISIGSNGAPLSVSYYDSNGALSISGENIGNVSFAGNSKIEFASVSGRHADFQLGMASAEIGKSLVDIKGDVNGVASAKLSITNSNAVVSMNGGIESISASLITDETEELPMSVTGDTAIILINKDNQPCKPDQPNSPVLPIEPDDGNDTANSSFPFVDVFTSDWFYDYVTYVYTNGLMDGVSATEFNPNGAMTRAMVWAILARIDGETVTGANWDAVARTWAMTSGVSDGTDANGLVTREQFATMLWRYAGEPASTYSLEAYTDASGVNEWAQTAMQWAVENGIITGVTSTTLEPQGTATRAQAAAMLMRYVENIK